MIPVKCWACGHVHDVTPVPGDRALAIGVMDHRHKFSGSSTLSLWFSKFGEARPEDVFPDLKGFDVDAYFKALDAPEVAGE